MTSNKQIFFFIFTFILYCITYFLGYYVGLETHIGKITFLILSVIFTLSLYGYVQIAGLFNENFIELSPYNCRKGPYMFQGNSTPVSQYCNALFSTPEGIAQIESQSCGKGYNNKPKNDFEDTPMSNDNWQNEMCL